MRNPLRWQVFIFRWAHVNPFKLFCQKKEELPTKRRDRGVSRVKETSFNAFSLKFEAIKLLSKLKGKLKLMKCNSKGDHDRQKTVAFGSPLAQSICRRLVVCVRDKPNYQWKDHYTQYYSFYEIKFAKTQIRLVAFCIERVQYLSKCKEKERKVG